MTTRVGKKPPKKEGELRNKTRGKKLFPPHLRPKRGYLMKEVGKNIVT